MEEGGGGGVACYIRNDLSYNFKSYFPKDIENIFFKLLLPNTKPIVLGTIYCPPNQTNFMEIFNENLSKVDTNNVETYILGDFNINLWQNGHYVFQKHNFLSCLSVPNDVIKYFDFCTTSAKPVVAPLSSITFWQASPTELHNKGY